MQNACFSHGLDAVDARLNPKPRKVAGNCMTCDNVVQVVYMKLEAEAN